MAVPLFRGKPYMTKFTISPGIPKPSENDELDINIGPKYSFTAGSSVIVSGFYDGSSRFEAIVDSYDASTGDMHLSLITNIQGFATSVGIFNITLTGQRGSRIVHGNGPPSATDGRPGDTYIDDSTGQIYYK
jgi:hypothetical protein